MPHAIIFIPAGVADVARLATECFAHCVKRGYTWYPVILRSWPAIEGIFLGGAQLVLVTPPWHMVVMAEQDPDRLPRWEPIGASPTEHPKPSSQRRAGRRRRSATDL